MHMARTTECTSIRMKLLVLLLVCASCMSLFSTLSFGAPQNPQQGKAAATQASFDLDASVAALQQPEMGLDLAVAGNGAPNKEFNATHVMWNSYRPQVYFGLRTAQKNAGSFDVMDYWHCILS